MGRPGRRRESRLLKEIRERLRAHVVTYCDANQSEFARRVGVSRSTVTGWFAGEPHAPDAGQLVVLARRGRMNLNWLLLGEEPQLRGAPHPGEKVFERARADVVAELAAEMAGSEVGAELIEDLLP